MNPSGELGSNTMYWPVGRFDGNLPPSWLASTIDLAWLTEQTSHRRLAIFIAHVGDDLAGLATTMVVPAPLRLGSSWQLRDLYVIPSARRRGVARALVGAVRQAATAAGAIRLSVQTEPGNIAALHLYRTSEFVPVEDIQTLALPIHSTDVQPVGPSGA